MMLWCDITRVPGVDGESVTWTGGGGGGGGERGC